MIEMSNAILVSASLIGAGALVVGLLVMRTRDPPLAGLPDQTQLMRGLSRILGSQFLSRIDEIIQFKLLEHHDLFKIASRLLFPIIETMAIKGMCLKIHQEVIDIIATSGSDEARGAHPMARTVDQLLKGPLSKLILNEQLTQGDQIDVQYRDGRAVFKVQKIQDIPRPAKH